MNPLHKASPERLDGIQALRAAAALLVLLGHLQTLAALTAARSGIAWPELPRLPGGFGVDLFFVISGFIMVVSSAGLPGQPGAARYFLLRRLFRLLPLYWAATLLFVGLRALSQRAWDPATWPALVQSLLFLPYRGAGDPEGLAYPLLSLGWTLNYEMQFYLLFGLSLALRRGSHGFTLGLLVLLVALGTAIGPAAAAPYFWTRPILLEFGLGVVIGLLWQQPWRIGTAAAATAAALAVACVLIDPLGLRTAAPGTSTPNEVVRLLGWGLPAALMVGAVALCHAAPSPASRSAGPAAGRWLRPFVLLGDASYALYLMHSFVLGALLRAWAAHPPQTGAALLVGVVLAAALSVLVAGLVYAAFERPATRWLQRHWLPRLQPGQPARPAYP